MDILFSIVLYLPSTTHNLYLYLRWLNEKHLTSLSLLGVIKVFLSKLFTFSQKFIIYLRRCYRYHSIAGKIGLENTAMIWRAMVILKFIVYLWISKSFSSSAHNVQWHLNLGLIFYWNEDFMFIWKIGGENSISIF